MPVAVLRKQDNPRRELKTAPPDGYVVVRRMSYGESLAREAIATKFTVGGDANSKEFSGDIKIDQERVALFDFATCIVEHNLTDENERLLNFKDPKDVKLLDKEIGREIGELIDEVNNTDTDETKNF